MTITWYGHSCFKIDSGGASVVFDPYAPGSVPGLELPPLSADRCVCSHGHHDHYYPEGVALTGRAPALVQQQVQCFHDTKCGSVRGDNTCTLIEMDGVRFLHMGDIGHPLSSAQYEQLGRVDVLMVPVGGYYTIDTRTAKQIKDALNARVTIPMHYRGEGFGYDNIATVDEFVSLCSDVVYFDGSTMEIDNIRKKCTAVLKCPVKG